MTEFEILKGNSVDVLKTLPEDFFQCCVTSPPYWQQRDYGHEDQLGLEESQWDFIDNLVDVFREVYRVMKPDGTVWLNINDSYTVSGKNGGSENWQKEQHQHWKQNTNKGSQIQPQMKVPEGLKRKELCGIPWRLVIKLQEEVGFYLRTEIVWNKIANMPDSVRDRPTRAHEYIFLLTKSDKYYYDYEASKIIGKGGDKVNLRSVWDVKKSMGYKDGKSHYATYPEELILPCINISSREGDWILDPFNGSGTTGKVALERGRNYKGIDINDDYIEISEKRLKEAQSTRDKKQESDELFQW